MSTVCISIATLLPFSGGRCRRKSVTVNSGMFDAAMAETMVVVTRQAPETVMTEVAVTLMEGAETAMPEVAIVMMQALKRICNAILEQQQQRVGRKQQWQYLVVQTQLSRI